MAAFAGAPVLSQAQEAEVPARGALTYTGVGAHGETAGLLAYSGVSNEPSGVSGALRYSGYGGPQELVAGVVGFEGLAPVSGAVKGNLAFSGVGTDGSGIGGTLGFVGPSVARPDRGSVTFRGSIATPDLPEVSLAYSGIRPGSSAASGPLSFAGCGPVDRLTAYLDDHPPEMWGPRSSPFIEFEGNYIVEWVESGLAPSFVTLTKGGDYEIIDTGDGNNLRQFYRDPDAEWFASAWVEEAGGGYVAGSDIVEVKNNGAMAIEWDYGHLGNWGGESSLFAGADAEFFGRWVYKDEGGSEYWTRVESHFTRVSGTGAQGFEVREVGDPITLTTPYVNEVSSMRGNRLAVELQLYGENLWGRHYTWISRRSGLEIDRVHYICYGGNEAARDDEDCFRQGGVIGLSISLNVWYDARSGLQKLFVDGREIPFYLEVAGAPPDTNCLAHG